MTKREKNQNNGTANQFANFIIFSSLHNIYYTK